MLVIILFATLYVRDSMRGPLLGRVDDPWEAAGLSLAPFLALWACLLAGMWLLRRRLERRASPSDVVLAERALMWSRLTAAVLHAAAVLCIGWLDAVRRVTGDLIALDEMIAVLPALATFAVGWWAVYPIDRRVREAMVYRAIDAGRAVYPIPGRWRFVSLHTRHQVLFLVVPLMLLLGWAELSRAALPRVLPLVFPGGAPRWGPEAVLTASQLLGVAATLSLMPLGLRVIFDTVVLGEGPMARALSDLCREAGVRVRRVLVWRTDGAVINGAVIGLWPRMRYILLTDALLDALPMVQINAVAAHEIAHIRCRHMIWLALCVLAVVLGVSTLMELGLRVAWGRLGWGELGAGAVASALVLGPTVLATLWLFGVVSRVFERQADAMAARQMSGRLSPGTAVFSPEGVGAMAGALESVATLNGLRASRFTWRHGSIRQRIDHLRSLEGVRLDAAPIDRAARRAKLLALAGLVAAAGLLIALPF